MLSKYRQTKRYSSWSVVASVGLHLSLMGGLIYASSATELPHRLNPLDDAPMNVIMLDVNIIPSINAVNISALDNLNQQTEPLIETEPELVPEPEMVQPVVEPETIPLKPILEERVIPEKKEEKKKPAAPIKPKVESKPKKDTKHKPAVETKARVSDSVNNTNVLPTITSTAPINGNGVSMGIGPKALNRSHPVYPHRARTMGVEGRVKVRFDVNGSGKVTNIRVLSESPKNMFANEVKRAMNRWRYEVNKIGKDLETTIVFKLDGTLSMS